MPNSSDNSATSPGALWVGPGEWAQPQLSHLGFQRMVPSPELRPFVKCFWFIHNPVNRTRQLEFMHPEGGTGMVFNYGDPLCFDNQPCAQEAVFYGATTSSRALSLDGAVDAVGIQFQPAGASAFLPMPLHTLKNHSMPLQEVLPQSVYHQLGDGSSMAVRVNILESWLRKQLRPEYKLAPAMTHAVELLCCSGGQLTMQGLADRLGLSCRSVERLFASRLGVSPKEFSKIVRVDGARRYLKQSELQLAAIAQELGYFDQAHFIRQFCAVIGVTPGIYRERAARRAAGL